MICDTISGSAPLYLIIQLLIRKHSFFRHCSGNVRFRSFDENSASDIVLSHKVLPRLYDLTYRMAIFVWNNLMIFFSSYKIKLRILSDLIVVNEKQKRNIRQGSIREFNQFYFYLFDKKYHHVFHC